MRGTVKSFNEQKGFGYITPDDGGKEAWVHFMAILTTEFKTLAEGQIVEFDVEQGQNGPSAANVRVIK